jgi:hypothetical protein
MIPTAHYENHALIVTLMRDGAPKAFSFADHRVEVEKTNDAYVMRCFDLTAPFDSDGFIHYIYACSEVEIGEEFAVRISAEEAQVLPKIIWGARKAWLAAKKVATAATTVATV